MSLTPPVARRRFLARATAAATAPFVSRLSWAGNSPMQRLQYAAVGAGGRGGSDIGSITRHKAIHPVAAADVDSPAREKFNSRFAKARSFTDWREMLQSMDEEIDVVSVSTPDHMHGIVAMSAMNLGMHVYVQKPLRKP